jgi:ketosteroid isomerase-like protein
MSAASNADKGVVRTFLEAWSEGDLDRAFALTDPDGVVWRLSFGGETSTVRVNLFETVSSLI